MHKTKILHIIPNLSKGGAERLVLDICTRLNQLPEVEVKLVCFSDKNYYLDTYISDFIKIMPSSIQISIYKKNKLQIDVLQEFINEFKPDIIHSHLFEAEIVSRSCYYPQAKWFSHCHDNMRQFSNFSISTLFYKQRLTEYYEKQYLLKQYKKNGGNHFISISKNNQAYFNQVISKHSISLLNNAIDYNKFNKPKILTNKTGIIRLINVGSLSENKNQIFLIEVAEILKKRNINFELHCLGDGKILNDLRSKAEKKSLTQNIIFHGNVPNVEEYLWKSDIYLHSAKSEALGLTIIEAMASGLPVITLDGKGNRDLIEQGKNGYMIFEQDAELFANAIIDLWNDKQKYQEMSEFAQKYAKQYDIKPYVEKLLTLYHKAIDEKI